MKTELFSKIYKNEVVFFPSRKSGFLEISSKNDKEQWRNNLKKLLKFEIKATLLVFMSVSMVLGFTFISLPRVNNVIAAEPKISATTNEMNAEGIIKFSNIERDKFSFNELEINEELTELANNRIEDMQKLGYFAHTNPEGLGLKQFVGKIDYDYLIVGENLSMNYYDNEEVVAAWMDSETHRDNILRPEFDEIGIGYGDVIINNKKVFIIAMILGKEKQFLNNVPSLEL